MTKIEAQLAKAPVGKDLVVLLTTGAMNPMHRGHVSMLEKTARQLSDVYGKVVVGAFISPSHDLYLEGKFRGKPGSYLPSAQRLALCRAGCDDHPLVAVSSWECSVSGRWPDFPEVAQAAEVALGTQFPRVPIKLIYCCGDDHAVKCCLHSGLTSTIGVCVVTRKNLDSPSVSRDFIARPECLLFVVNDATDDTSTFSSTGVRKALAYLQAALHPDELRLLVQ